MGAKRLKIKEDLRYRKGGESVNCKHCNSFVGDFRRHGLGGDFIATEARCRVIGLMHGVPYRVRPDYRCDRWNNSIDLLCRLGEIRFRELYGFRKCAAALESRAERERFEQVREY